MHLKRNKLTASSYVTAFIRALLLLILSFPLTHQAFAQLCATPGQDGPTNAGMSINTYYPALGSVTLAAGANSIVLDKVPDIDSYGNNFGTTQISSGDLLMVIQMQDAEINFSNTTSYGSGNSAAGPDGLGATGYTSLGSAGKFEFLVATNSVPLTGGLLTFKGAGTNSGAVNTYRNADPTVSKGKSSFQIIRITQYSNFVLSSDISPPPFNGSAGGIIAFNVAGIMDFNGHVINVTAKGFRGGYSLRKNPTLNYRDIYVTVANDSRTSGKGEGIAGTPRYMWDGFNQVDNLIEGLPSGSAGRGAPANAGGGGNDTNSGGGGGGNGGAGGVGAWGYEPYGGTYPNGGRPGSEIYLSGPADLTRLIMGGGGGGGHANDALTGVKGGVGGGIVFINAKTIIGNATILADGASGAPGAFGGNPDGSGGGGAGGTVFIRVSQPDPGAVINIRARGGRGGNTEGDDINGVQPHGPGGGGGGGTVLYDMASGTKNIDVSAGLSGRTNSGNGGPHHAEGGRSGVNQIFSTGALPPYLQEQNVTCYPQLVTELIETDPTAQKTAGSTATFTITISNTATDGNAGGVVADVMLPNGLTFKTATAAYTGAAGGPSNLVNVGTANRLLLGDFNISPGDRVVITLLADIDCGAPSATYHTSVQALYLDPTRDITDPNRRITAANNAFPGSNTTYQNATGNVPGINYNGNTTQGEEVIVFNNISNQLSSANPPEACSAAFDPLVITGTGPFGGTETYIWQISTDSINFADISGATSKDYDPSVINTTTYYRRILITGSCTFQSNVIAISILPPLLNNTISSPPVTTFCDTADPNAITGSTPTGGDGTYAYQWQSSTDGTNFADISAASLKDYDPPVISSTVYYQRVVLSGNCATSVSNIIQFSAQPQITNNQVTAPSNVDFCGNGDPDIITGSTPAGGNGTFSYQWQYSTNGTDFFDIAGATMNDYDPSVISSTVYYRRKVISGLCETLSNVVQMTIQPAVSDNTITAPQSAAFCGQGDAGFIAGNIPPGAVTYLYQWQSSTDNVVFTDVPGAMSNNYDPPLLTTTTYYRRIVSSAVCVVPLISNVVTILIDPALSDNAITAPAINAFCDTGNPDVITGSTPAGGNGTFTYQWQSSADGIAFADIPGADQKDFDPPLLSSTTFYRRMVTSGNCLTPLISNTLQIIIDPLVTGNAIIAPAVTAFCGNSQPGIITGNTPSGGNGVYIYQWQSSADNSVFTDISNATQKDYAHGVLNTSTYFRRSVTSGSCAIGVISNTILIQIEPVVENNIIAPPIVSAFCSTGDPSVITGNTPTGGNGTYTYQWQTSTDGANFTDIPGADLKDYDPPVITVTTYFRRMVASGICNIPQSSNIITITIDVMPAITLQPDVTICQGTGTNLNATGGNNNYIYQWFPAAGLSNTNTPNPLASPDVTTTYTLTVTNGLCSTTVTTTVNVIPQPTVNAGIDKEILKGNSILLDAVTTGPDLQYSWSPSLYLDNPNVINPIATPPDDITYTLTVSSPNNCFIVSDDVFIRVYPKIAPPNTFTPNSDGINDTWEIPGLNTYKSSVVNIFNRNGSLLHQSIGYLKPWDGTHNGKTVPFGTYYYTIDLKNGSKVLSGWVAVVK